MKTPNELLIIRNQVADETYTTSGKMTGTLRLCVTYLQWLDRVDHHARFWTDSASLLDLPYSDWFRAGINPRKAAHRAYAESKGGAV